MSYALSGTKVIQTGTDTALAGVIGLAGVEDIDLGDARVIHLNNLMLEVQGVLSYDGTVEFLFFNNQLDTDTGDVTRNHDISVLGTLTIDLSEVNNGTYYLPIMPYFSRRPPPSTGSGAHNLNTDGASFVVENGGTANLIGGTYSVQHNFAVASGGTLNVTGSTLIGVNRRFWLDVGSVTNFNDCTLINQNLFFNSFPATFNNVVMLSCGAIQKERAGITFDLAPNFLINPTFINTSAQMLGIWRGGWLRCKNSLLGSAQGVSDSTLSGGTGICEYTMDMAFRVRDNEDALVEGYKWWARETDDGTRRVITSGTSYDNTTIRTYTFTTDALGETSVVEMYLASGTRSITGPAGNYQYTTYSNTTDDEYDFVGIGYNHNISAKRIQLRNSGPLISNENVIVDTLLTETNRANLASYNITVSVVGNEITFTGNGATLRTMTAEQMYDLAKDWLVTNFNGEQALLVTRSGNAVDAGSYDVVFDYITYEDNLNANSLALNNGSTIAGVLNGQLDVVDGATYTTDIDGKFVVDTDTVTSFTISGFIPTEIEHIGSGSTTILGINNAKLTTTTITATGGTLVLGDGLNPSANFTKTGDTIQLAATETSPLGLRGRADVDYSLSAGKYTYTLLGETRIELLSGADFTIDPDVEKIVGGVTPGSNQNTIIARSGCRLQIGRETTSGGFTSFSEGDALVFTNNSSSNGFNFNNSWSNLKIEAGATLDWYGGNVITRGVIGWDDGATVNTYSKNAKLIFLPNSSSAVYAQLRQASALVTFNGFVLEFGKYTALANLLSGDGYSPQNAASAIDLSSSTPDNVFMRFRNFTAGQGNTADVALKDNKWVRLINCNLGLGVGVEFQGSGTDAGLTEVRREVVIQTLDALGSPLNGVRVYGVSTDHGNRLSANTFNNNADYTVIEDYDATSSGGQVSFTGETGSVLMGLITRNSGVTLRSHCLTNDAVGGFIFRSYLYGYNIGEINVNLTGENVLTVQNFNTVNLSTTETNKATVQAYPFTVSESGGTVTVTGNGATLRTVTARELYDALAAYVDDNPELYTSFLASRSGDELNFGSLNVTMDYIDYFGDIVTTGNFTQTNGGYVGTITDLGGAAKIISGTLNNLDGYTVEIFDNTNTSVQRYTNQTGTLVFRTSDTATGTWRGVIDKVGFRRLRFSFNTQGENFVLDASLEQLIKSDGNPMYSGGTYPNITTHFDFVTPQWSIDFAGRATAQQIIDAMEDALITVDGMRWQNEIGSYGEADTIPGAGDIIKFRGLSIRIRREAPADVDAEAACYVLSDDTAIKDGSNGDVIIQTGLSQDFIRDAILNADNGNHLNANSVGLNISKAGQAADDLADGGRLDLLIDAIITSLESTLTLDTTVVSASGNTVQLAEGSTIDGKYAQCLVTVGEGIDEETRICRVYLGATRIAAVDGDWNVNPAIGSRVRIRPARAFSLSEIKSGLASQTDVLLLGDQLVDILQASGVVLTADQENDIKAGLATQSSLTDVFTAVDGIKGAGWTTETLKNIRDNIGTGGTTPSDVYDYFTALSRADAFKADVSQILNDTNEIQGDLTAGGRLDLIFAAMKLVLDTFRFTGNDAHVTLDGERVEIDGTKNRLDDLQDPSVGDIATEILDNNTAP